MKKPLFKQRKKQLKFLSMQLSKLTKANVSGNESLIERITLKIKKLLHEMRFAISKHELKGLLGAVAIVFGISMSNNADAQSFGPKQNSPFGIDTDTSYFNPPAFADLDNDGDLDLLTIDEYGTFRYYANTGTPANAQFAPVVANAFNLPATGYYSFPTFVDMDSDGDYDLMVSTTDYYYSSYATLTYHENTGSPAMAQFAAGVDNPFGIMPVTYNAFPTFADLDADGDIDLLMGTYGGDLHYYENTGNATTPAFSPLVVNPFGLTPGIFIAIPDVADLDEDGDLDIMLGQLDTTGNNTLLYFENTGSVTMPQFAAGVINPFNLAGSLFISLPKFADIDNDADMDLFVMEAYGNLSFYENTSSISLAEASAFNFNIFPVPVKDILNIKSAEELHFIEVLDVNGRRILKTQSQKVDVSMLVSGMYILKLVNKDGKESIRKFSKL